MVLILPRITKKFLRINSILMEIYCKITILALILWRAKMYRIPNYLRKITSFKYKVVIIWLEISWWWETLQVAILRVGIMESQQLAQIWNKEEELWDKTQEILLEPINRGSSLLKANQILNKSSSNTTIQALIKACKL